MNPPVFVVGTGRCGSTMLSNMLREHPQVLSLSEFFSLVTDGSRSEEPFSRELMDGRRFWSIVAAVTPFLSFVLRHQRVQPVEQLYDFERPAARYSRASGVPAPLLIALPHLSDDYEALFDQLQSEAVTWPSGPIADHYHRLFGMLAARFGKRIWVERSGASLGRIGRLLELFPDARFVHIVRDGRDVALSMQADTGFRIAHVLGAVARHIGVDPLASSDRSGTVNLPENLRSFLPEAFDIDALEAYEVPLPLCGAPWARQIAIGLDSLAILPPERVLTLRYEDILADPLPAIAGLGAFLGDGFADECWAARCAALVRAPRFTWRALPEEEARALTEACRPGFELLRAAGVSYDM